MVPNEKNLKRLSPSEARKNGRKGGKASAQSRRQRKTLKENMNLLLSLDVANTKDFNKLTSMGIPMEDIDNAMLLTAALFQKAKSGDVAAAREVREWLGEGGKDGPPTQENNLLEAIAASTGEDMDADDLPEIE